MPTDGRLPPATNISSLSVHQAVIGRLGEPERARTPDIRGPCRPAPTIPGRSRARKRHHGAQPRSCDALGGESGNGSIHVAVHRERVIEPHQFQRPAGWVAVGDDREASGLPDTFTGLRQDHHPHRRQERHRGQVDNDRCRCMFGHDSVDRLGQLRCCDEADLAGYGENDQVVDVGDSDVQPAGTASDSAIAAETALYLRSNTRILARSVQRAVLILAGSSRCQLTIRTMRTSCQNRSTLSSFHPRTCGGGSSAPVWLRQPGRKARLLECCRRSRGRRITADRGVAA